MAMDQGTAVDKALDVLFRVHEEREAQGVSDLARALSMPKSTTHRMLTALRRRGLVEQDEAGRYRPGFGLLVLASGLLGREPLVAAAQGVLAEAAEELGETFFLVAARAGRLLVLEKAEGTGVLRVSPEIGSEVPVHATAIGKLYLGHAPHLVESPGRERFTGSTIVDSERLAREGAEARTRGFALNDEEWIEGLAVVAAPVFVAGELAGGVCAAMSTTRFRAAGLNEVAGRVVAAAATIESRMEGVST